MRRKGQSLPVAVEVEGGPERRERLVGGALFGHSRPQIRVARHGQPWKVIQVQPGVRVMTESASHLRVIEETPAYWRVVFDNPPLNIMDADMFEGLQDVLARMDASPSLRVVVFESANPDFYLAHFEVKDTARTLTLLKTVGPSGLPSLLDTFVRLTKSPVVSIAKIRCRARGVASEFLLA